MTQITDAKLSDRLEIHANHWERIGRDHPAYAYPSMVKDMRAAAAALTAAAQARPTQSNPWKRGDVVLLKATLNAPTNKEKPNGHWWVDIHGRVGLIVVHEREMIWRQVGLTETKKSK